MAETALQRSVFTTTVLESPVSSRHISGGEWQRVGVFSSPADVGDEIAISFDAISDAGVVGEVRLRTSTGQVTNPALVQGGPLTNGLVGFLVVSGSSPNYCYLEARGQSGNPGGIRVSKARLIDIAGVPAALLNGPHYPPGYNSVGGADLSIGANNVAVLQGAQAQIVPTITNNGPDPSGSFDVLVEIPNGGTLNTGASSAGAVVAGSNISVPVSGPVASGTSVQLTVAFDIAGGAPVGGQTLDVSVANQSAADPNIGNDSSTMTLTISEPIEADLSISATSPTGDQGASATVTVDVTNNGPDTSGTWSMDIDIPAGTTFNSGASTSGGTISGSEVQYSGSALSNGATDSFDVVFDIAAGATIGNESLAVRVFNQSETDPVSGNDTTTSTFTIQAPPATGADLYVTLPANTDVEQGEQLSILVTVGNNGPDTSGLYDFSIDIPNGGTFNAGASTPGSTVNGGVVEWSAIQTIPNGQTDTLTAVFDMAAGAPLGNQTIDADIFNQAVTDPNASNDTDSMQINVTAPATSVFPSTVATSQANNSTQVTDHDLVLPSGIQVGDLILTHTTFHGSAATATPQSGFTTFINESSGSRTMLVTGKVAAGNESGTTVTITTPTGKWSCTNCLVIRDFHGSLTEGTGWDKATTPVTGNGSSINPPSVTASWGSDKNMFVALGTAENDDATVNAYPTGWDETQLGVVGGGGTDAGCTAGTATYTTVELATHNPSTFTLSQSEGIIGHTMVLRPA